MRNTGRRVHPTALVAGVAALIAVTLGQSLAAQIGQEKGLPLHLQDGQEQQMPLRKLIAFGESLFVARFTTSITGQESYSGLTSSCGATIQTGSASNSIFDDHWYICQLRAFPAGRAAPVQPPKP